MVTVILKVTEKCNSNCAYCDVVARKAESQHMPLDILELFFERANQFLEDHPKDRLMIIFHGGEPLLLGPEYYKTANEFQLKYCRKTRGRIEYALQTNLTLFSEEYADVFHSLGLKQLGTSYDPEPCVRGPGTPNNSDIYNCQFMRGDALAQRCGFKSGVIYVVTKKSLKKPLDIFYFLTNLRPEGGINMNPVLLYDKRRNDLAVSPEEYVRFLGSIFPMWWENQKRYPEINPFSSITRTVRDNEMVLACAESGMCSHDHINIDPRGEASQCGRSSDWGLLAYGNIQECSLDDILSDPQRMVLQERNELLHSGECRSCRFWTICHGGCPLDPYPDHASFMHRSVWGCARKAFIEEHFEPVTGLRFVPHA